MLTTQILPIMDLLDISKKVDKIIIIPTGTIPTCKKGTRDASIINLTNFLSKKIES